MKSGAFMKLMLVAYVVVFFGYLLGPLAVMSVTAFNSPSFPKAAPWECLTFEWFDVLAHDERILNGLKNSAIVGFGTVIISVVLGLAGALVLTQIWPRLRATYYTVVIAPILIPGVVLGISTLVFWGRINTMLGFPDDSFLRNGIFLTILGQSTFIASYCMLVFIARLARFDDGQMEAALDLGATHAQAFRKILLPFLKPAFGSAAVIAFLASFENYNTTTFTFGTYPTLTIELAQKVRYGINPSISALAVIIVVLTVFGALFNEAYQRHRALAVAGGAPIGAAGGGIRLPAWLQRNAASWMLLVLTVVFLGTTMFGAVHDPSSCKTEIRELKRQQAEERRNELQRRIEERRRQEQFKGPNIFAPDTPTGPGGVPLSPGKGTFGDVFNPQNLNEAGPKGQGGNQGGGVRKSPGAGTFGDVFNPQNLNEAGPQGQGGASQNPGKGTFGDVFNPGNLNNGTGAQKPAE
ncbi:MAG: ABC transporter permease [Hyphomicrobiales bacterium]|nr:ABC transporter permease [Hyphomicrobiales bacterium]